MLQTVNKGSTTITTVTSSANPSVFGRTVIFTALTVTPGSGKFDNGGTVQFAVDGNDYGGAVRPSGGRATIADATLSVGTHTITARYSGDANFGASSGVLSGGETITKAGTMTTVTSSPNSSVYGQSVTFTATVTAGSGTFDNGGTVQFAVDGINYEAPASLSGGKATITDSTLSVGTHSITAVYGGDSNFTGSSGSLAQLVPASTGIITTIAGNGSGGYSGDGGAATATGLDKPFGVAVDAAGNIYIADTDDNCIRKVSACTGIITTVAGNGSEGYSGDGGAATATGLFFPSGVAVDAAGNLYIADTYDQRIRKVSASTGIITTVAGNGDGGYSGDGGAATEAGLFYPSGVAVDAAGNLYIADTFDNRIREVSASTGFITTIAGNGSPGYSGDGGAASAAGLYYPQSVAVDAAGNIYVADTYNQRIREILTSSRIIITIAGNGSPGYSGDGGAATAAGLFYPSGVAVDSAGNLYIADTDDHRIREVSASTGIITTIAGIGSEGYSGDGGAATAAGLDYPEGVAVDTAGNLFIADAENNVIRAVSSGLVATLQTVSQAGTTLVTTPSSTIVTLDSTAPTLSDSAVLSGGYYETGTIIFTLYYNGGTTPVDTETVTVNGNDIYTTPTGYTLPTTGTVAGNYQWDASYSGDGNNNSASDNNDPAEQVTVSLASPTLVTTPSSIIVTLDLTAPPLTDSAVLSGGYNETGTIIFTLYYNGGTTPVDSETVTVNGNGTYTTPTGYTLPTTGTVTGSYQWDATYSGDGNNNPASDNNDPAEQVTVNPASPTLVTTPSSTIVTLDLTAPTLTDSAVLSGGYNETGTITFTLYYNGGSTPVDTETVTVNGDGTYTTPTGYTLPATGTVTGSYQWDASYSGDGNNNSASDNNDPAEQVTVNPASPTLVTTPSSTFVTLDLTAPSLTDSAVLSGGYYETGTITFTLYYNGGSTPVDTETVTVNGNGTYTTPTGYTLPATGTVAGSYQWDASYSGDGNNNSASDNNDPAEQVTVSPASPTLVTTPSSTIVTLDSTAPTLTDSAVLSGGYNETGTITFTLYYNGGSTPVDTETVTVNGDGTYTTPTGYTLPTTGTVTGSYQWDASYSGDGNNNSASDNNDPAEQVTVNPASPTLVTTPSSTIVTLGSTAPTLTDSAVLSGGYYETGTITFTLYYNGGTTPVDSETVTVNGNGTYTTPTGYTLPATGTVTGSYQWDASYGGDGNNNPASDNNDTAEQVTVNPASPTLMTTPSSTFVTLGSTAPTLTDSAVLSGGYNETGTITFTLYYNGGTTPVDSETVTVNGNGTYTTPTGYTLPTTGTVAGSYQWDASYGGDGNNNSASDNNDPAEQVTVSPASPTLVTTPSSTIVTLGSTAPTLTDSAVLSGGYNETGTITFTLYYNGGSTPVDTETVTVNGNGIYTTPTGYTLPTTGTVTGSYRWDASYGGDGNNNSASDNNDPGRTGDGEPGQPDAGDDSQFDHCYAGFDGPDTDRLGGAVGRLLRDRHDHLHALLQRRHHACGHRNRHGKRQRHLHDADRLHAAGHGHGDGQPTSGTPATAATATTTRPATTTTRPSR